MEYLPKPAAQRLYRIAQEREEAAIEERRQREMEARRAGAANVQVNAASAEPSQEQGNDPVQRLAKLKSMLDQGLIDQAEFDAKKADILSSMSSGRTKHSRVR